jgi:hypothetical protein
VIKAHETRTDTTYTPIPIIPPSGGDPIQNPAPSPIILAFQLEGEIVLRMSNLNVDFVEISIKNQVSNERLYFSIVQNITNNIHIDISFLPCGTYIISIKDGDDEYVGEFEVF